MKRVLVTGASGFLGRHVVRALAARGDYVVCLVRDLMTPALQCPNVTVRGSFEEVERTIAEYEIDVVVHLAAQVQVSVAAAHPTGTLETNIRGTWRVLEACRRQTVKKVVVASSDKAYGDWITPYSEAQPLVPHGIYATSKACEDMLAQAYLSEYKMPIAITRSSNLYGPEHTNWTTLIPGTIRSFLKRQEPRFRSDGGPKRDFLYVGDVVDGYLKLVDSEATGPFNFGTGKGTTVLETASTIARLMGCKLDWKFEVEAVLQDRMVALVTGPPAEGARIGAGGVEIKDQVVDASKAARELGWKATHTLEQGLQKTIDWYRLHLEALG